MDTINQLFNIKYPIIQGGMIWCSGWELASQLFQMLVDWDL
jgi:enoyl-[acyl-carrier protein] reductase II